MTFSVCIHPCNHLHIQDNEHFLHPRSSLLCNPSLPALPETLHTLFQVEYKNGKATLPIQYVW